jgi:hypothetical protein
MAVLFTVTVLPTAAPSTKSEITPLLPTNASWCQRPSLATLSSE